jgi:hypothetical protein
MKVKGLLWNIFLVAGMMMHALSQDSLQMFDRKAYYLAMEENKMDLVDKQLGLLGVKHLPTKEKDAFVGAMTMKKAGLTSNPEKRLDLFKHGHKKLESAIRKDTVNAEFRFLRLMIQEHSPRALGYKSSLQIDSQHIRDAYKSLPKELQEAVFKYSKKSKVLLLDAT